VKNTGRLGVWGHLKEVETGRETVTATTLDGKVYETGERGPVFFVLECDCGYRFKVTKATFPGKRKMRSCVDFDPGREGVCLHSKPQLPKPKRPLGRPAGISRGLAKSIYFPVPLISRIDKFATAREGGNFSRAVVALVERALESYERDNPGVA